MCSKLQLLECLERALKWGILKSTLSSSQDTNDCQSAGRNVVRFNPHPWLAIKPKEFWQSFI